ncbi:MAG TPA: class 1 fructose-bisphosphatase [Terriglobales bacterium]
MKHIGTTLTHHLLEEEHRFQHTSGELSRVLSQLGLAAKVLQAEISRAALDNELGYVGTVNTTGDAQKKLDVFANNVVTNAFAETGLVAGIISEESDQLEVLSTGASAKYVLCIDPIDGSSNTDINGTVGTIFSVYRRKGSHEKSEKDIQNEVLTGQADHVAAGYVMFGTSTLLVYTAGGPLNGFTLDRTVGEFLLSHRNIQCPKHGKTYSANLGHYCEWPDGVKKYVDWVQNIDAPSGRPYSLRYTGSLTADLHRTLVEGGLYFYPPDANHTGGKLRLMYEMRPLAMVVEAAGGRASDGRRRILEIPMEGIHQQGPFVIGSAENVAEFERFNSEAAGAGH